MPKVSLGPIFEADLPQMLQWRNHPSIMRWNRQSDYLTEARHREWFDNLDYNTTRMYAVRKTTGPLVGIAGLTSIDWAIARAEFSLYIGTEYQRMGFGKAALELLLDHGFVTLGLHMIWGESFTGNPAQKIFDAVGMKRDGVRRDFYRKNGEYVDAHLFSILRREWVLDDGQ